MATPTQGVGEKMSLDECLEIECECLVLDDIAGPICLETGELVEEMDGCEKTNG